MKKILWLLPLLILQCTSSRDVNLIISKVDPPVPTIDWRLHTNTQCPSLAFYDVLVNNLGPSSFTSTFSFSETLGGTWAQIQSFSIAYGSNVSGVDLSKHNFSGGINLLVPKGGENSTGLQTFSSSLLSDVGPNTTQGFNPILATITFTGKTGVGKSFTVSANYTFIQLQEVIEDLTCPTSTSHFGNRSR